MRRPRPATRTTIAASASPVASAGSTEDTGTSGIANAGTSTTGPGYAQAQTSGYAGGTLTLNGTMTGPVKTK